MISKRLFLSVCAALMTLGMSAQNAEDIKKQIANIKRSTAIYITGEATAQTPEDARNMAEENLYNNINEWAATKKRLQNSKNFIVKNKDNYSLQYLSTTRGNMFRSFVFVKKTDIVSGDNVTVIDNTSVNAMGSKVEVLGHEKSATQEKVVTIPPVVMELAQISEYEVLAQRIISFKTKGEIIDYDRYAKLLNPDDYYMAVYNREGKVVAVLTKGANRANVRTGQPDSLANYKGCGAIGFKLKK